MAVLPKPTRTREKMNLDAFASMSVPETHAHAGDLKGGDHNLGEKKQHRIKAKVTIEHSSSSYGQPVIVLEDGGALDLFSWMSLGYQVVRASKKELAWLTQIGLV